MGAGRILGRHLLRRPGWVAKTTAAAAADKFPKVVRIKMPSFEQSKFSVGPNDKRAARLYADRYEHSTGKCMGAVSGCSICTDEAMQDAVDHAAEECRGLSGGCYVCVGDNDHLPGADDA